LFTQLQVKVFLLRNSPLQVLRRERDFLLCSLIQRLQFIQQLPLVQNVSLLFIKLSSQFAELKFMVVFLVLDRSLEVTFFLLLPLDGRLFILHLHP
jgi:hypothetical protein